MTRITSNGATGSGRKGFENTQSPPRKNDDVLIRRFQFEISASIGFTVQAASESEAHQQAESCRALLNQIGPSGLSPEHEVYVVVGDDPDLLEE